MNELQVNELNESINYDEGKIYWIEGKNYSSKLWENCYKQGWKMTTYKSGLVDIKDEAGNRIVNGEIGRVNALYRLAKVMR